MKNLIISNCCQEIFCDYMFHKSLLLTGETQHATFQLLPIFFCTRWKFDGLPYGQASITVFKGCDINIFKRSVKLFGIQEILFPYCFSEVCKISVYKICNYTNSIDGLNMNISVDKKGPEFYNDKNTLKSAGFRA